MNHTVLICVSLVLMAAGLGILAPRVWAWIFPKGTPRHHIPSDIKQWPSHYVDHTSEFSAVPAGQNKHYVPITATSSILGQRTDTTAMPVIRLQP